MTKTLALLPICIFIFISCKNGNEKFNLSNIPSMPVYADKNHYDNFNHYTDKSQGHPVGKILKPVITKAAGDGVPGIVILVETPQSGSWVFADGKIDLKNDIPMKKNSMSRIGSISKMFTAVVILQLKQGKKLSLDDPVKKYLEADTIRSIENADSATIRQLLNHTSGIVNYTDYLDVQTLYTLNSNKDQTSMKALDTVRGKKAYFKPGAGCYYSNTDYVLLGLIIEKVTGKFMKQVYQEKIFTPLGMKSTYYDPENPVHKETARGYAEYEGNLIDGTDFDQATRTPDGGIVSNVYDLAVFIKALMRDNKLLSKSTLAEMTDNMVRDSKNGFYNSLGIISETFPNGETMYGHSGGHFGYTAELWYFPSKDMTFTYLINGSSFFGRSGKVLRGFLSKTVTPLVIDEPGKGVLKKIAPSWVASIRKTIPSYGDQTALRKELDGTLEKDTVVTIAPAYTVYHGNSGQGYDVEVVQTVMKPGKSSGVVKYYQTEACETAALVSKGPYTLIPDSYVRLNGWIEERGYRTTGPNREYYYKGEWNEKNQDEWLMEIRIPVKRSKGY